MIVREISCKTLVHRTGGFLDGFTHSLNPYGGCSYGGTLCGMPDYAPEIAKARGERRPWGSYLDVKVNAPEVYAVEHDRIRKSPQPALRIYMSSVTDPYVPQERRYRISQRLLSAMQERPPDLLALQTHTPHPLWDIDLLERLSRRFPLSVQISVETDQEDLGPHFRPHAYPVASRLDALSRLADRGIHTVGVVAPMWPLADAESFARKLRECCSFVVLDHYLLGDGTCGGARTARREAVPGVTFPDLLRRAGFDAWTRLEPFEEAVRTFQSVLSPGRVGVSKDGFTRAAHVLLAGDRIGPGEAS